MDKYIPKMGETIVVSDNNYDPFKKDHTAEFIAMTSDDRYLCWDYFKTIGLVWRYGEPTDDR